MEAQSQLRLPEMALACIKLTNGASTGSLCETELTHLAVLVTVVSHSTVTDVCATMRAAILDCFIGVGAQTQVLLIAQQKLLPISHLHSPLSPAAFWDKVSLFISASPMLTSGVHHLTQI